MRGGPLKMVAPEGVPGAPPVARDCTGRFGCGGLAGHPVEAVHRVAAWRCCTSLAMSCGPTPKAHVASVSFLPHAAPPHPLGTRHAYMRVLLHAYYTLRARLSARAGTAVGKPRRKISELQARIELRQRHPRRVLPFEVRAPTVNLARSSHGQAAQVARLCANHPQSLQRLDTLRRELASRVAVAKLAFRADLSAP
eukprot:scaffold29901_cov63-Phaeocystis_antarctica.AAC.7